MDTKTRVFVERYSERHREEALADLRAELMEFAHDGLVKLAEDLRAEKVKRGDWSGCVISYKHGAPGSVHCDRLGRKRNQFTVLWDFGWLTDADVLAEVDAELARRAVVPEAEPATAGA